jgi:diaminopimelate decarboxylase
MGTKTERRMPTPEVLSANRESVFRKVAERFGTPTYVYFQQDLEDNVDQFLCIPALNGLRVRYAMKANPNAAVLRVFDKKGAHFDASTFNEVLRAMDPNKAAIDGSKISLTSQEVQTPDKLRFLAAHGVSYTASSLEQLRTYGEVLPGTEVGVRFNVGIGSGWHGHTSTGGEGSPFGIYEQREEIDTLLQKHNLTLRTVHLHIGSGTDPEKQKEAIAEGLELVKKYPTVTTLNMGGGFKVARMNYEKGTDIEEMGNVMSQALADFEEETGRKIALEVEPGTALVANAGAIVTKVIDKISGPGGSIILKVDGGMHVNPRPPLYAAQHPLNVVQQKFKGRDYRKTFVYGMNCESGDTLTPRSGNPGEVEARHMQDAEIGDLVVVGGAGAYTSSMASNYNSLGFAAEVLVRENGKLANIRRRQKPKEIWESDRIPSDLASRISLGRLNAIARRYRERRFYGAN